MRDRIVSLRRVKASELIPNAKNWRTHPESQKAAIRGILNEVGWVDALLARETEHGLELIDGHLRQEIDPDAEVPVIVVDLDDAEAAKVLATFDPISAMAGCDAGMLDDLLKSIETDDDALSAMMEELAKDNGIEVDSEEIVEDEVPEVQEVAITKTGDLWLLGAYFECEDCGKKYDYETGKNMKECPCG